MKLLQRLSILLAVVITNHATSINAQPMRGGARANLSRANSSHDTQQSVAGIQRAESHQKNQEAPSSAQIGAASLHRNTQMQNESSTTTSTSPDSSTTSAPQTPVIPAQAQIQQPIALTNAQATVAPAPTTNANIANSAPIAATTPIAPAQVTPSQPVSEIQTSNTTQIINTPHTDTEKQIAEDLDSIPADQDKILEQLKMIDMQDKKNYDLLNMASMDQLFNNFVYFKNFIVENFAKEKMLRLALEFINQLYPAENIPSITLNSATDTSSTSAETSTAELSASSDVSQTPDQITPASTITPENIEPQDTSNDMQTVQQNFDIAAQTDNSHNVDANANNNVQAEATESTNSTASDEGLFPDSNGEPVNMYSNQESF